MGIKFLSQLLNDNAPSWKREHERNNYFGRKIAIDGSMSLYQFLIALVGKDGSYATGEITSHLSGTFYRTIQMVSHGIKPVYVFDGKPGTDLPSLGDEDAPLKFNPFKVTQKHVDECKKLLGLMGIPVVEAPCEAEAQCAVMAKSGLVYATSTEDVDALTFGSPILLRHLTFSETRKMPIKEFHLQQALEHLNLTMDQFIDLCILLGCDYCDSVRGVGPVMALKYIKQYKNLETIVQVLRTKSTKYAIPDPFPIEQVRELFKNPEVIDPSSIELKWTDPDEEGLVEFLCNEKQFSEERVRAVLKKWRSTSS